MSQEFTDTISCPKRGNERTQMGTRGKYLRIQGQSPHLKKSAKPYFFVEILNSPMPSPQHVNKIIFFQVLEQRFQKLQSERDELHANFVTAVQEVVQKANFKKLLLERKVVALADSLEKKDAQVNMSIFE